MIDWVVEAYLLCELSEMDFLCCNNPELDLATSLQGNGILSAVIATKVSVEPAYFQV